MFPSVIVFKLVIDKSSNAIIQNYCTIIIRHLNDSLHLVCSGFFKAFMQPRIRTLTKSYALKHCLQWISISLKTQKPEKLKHNNRLFRRSTKERLRGYFRLSNRHIRRNLEPALAQRAAETPARHMRTCSDSGRNSEGTLSTTPVINNSWSPLLNR